MRKSWLLLSVIPLLTNLYGIEDELLYQESRSEDALMHIAFDDELSEDSTNHYRDPEGDTFASYRDVVDEVQDDLFPWALDDFVQEEAHSYVRRQAERMAADLDATRDYEAAIELYEYEIYPTFENIPRRRRRFFSRPRVVESEGSVRKRRPLEERSSEETKPLKKRKAKRTSPKTVAENSLDSHFLVPE